MIPNQRHLQLVEVPVLDQLLFPSVIPPVKVLDIAIESLNLGQDISEARRRFLKPP
jgi:hypothetical protein